jgi:hypothetical protein
VVLTTVWIGWGVCAWSERMDMWVCGCEMVQKEQEEQQRRRATMASASASGEEDGWVDGWVGGWLDWLSDGARGRAAAGREIGHARRKAKQEARRHHCCPPAHSKGGQQQQQPASALALPHATWTQAHRCADWTVMQGGETTHTSGFHSAFAGPWEAGADKAAHIQAIHAA